MYAPQGNYEHSDSEEEYESISFIQKLLDETKHYIPISVVIHLSGLIVKIKGNAAKGVWTRNDRCVVCYEVFGRRG